MLDTRATLWGADATDSCGKLRVCVCVCGVKMAELPPIVDVGVKEYPTLLSFNMPPNGGPASLTMSPEALAAATGTTLGPCSAALALNSMLFKGSNMPANVAVVVSTGDGKPFGGGHASNIVTAGGVQGVHVVCRAGDHHGNLDTEVKLQPPRYPEDATRADLMRQAVSTNTNWKDARGTTADKILTSSIARECNAIDEHNKEHSRVLLHPNSLLDRLFVLNRNSGHHVMANYNDEVTIEGQRLVTTPDARDLAKILEKTLAACHPIAQSGLKVTVTPLPDASGQLPKYDACTGVLDTVLRRENILDILDASKAKPQLEKPKGLITTADLAAGYGLVPKDAETDAAMFDVKVGGSGPIKSLKGTVAGPAQTSEGRKKGD